MSKARKICMTLLGLVTLIVFSPLFLLALGIDAVVQGVKKLFPHKKDK